MSIAVTVTHTKTLVNPSSGSDDKVYGSDYVSASSHAGTWGGSDASFASGVLTIGGSTVGAGLTITNGSVTANSNPLLIMQTRNNAAITFDGAIKVVITDTASAAASLALQVLGGASGTALKFSVGKDSNFGIGQTLCAIFGGVAADSVDLRIQTAGGDVLFQPAINSTNNFDYLPKTGGVNTISGGVFGWGSSASTVSSTIVTGISQISSGLVGVGTGAQGSFAGRLKLTSTITAAVAVGSLNASPTIGEVQTVNDALAVAAKGATVAAGGSAVCQVMWNGSNWVGI